MLIFISRSHKLKYVLYKLFQTLPKFIIDFVLRPFTLKENLSHGQSTGEDTVESEPSQRGMLWTTTTTPGGGGLGGGTRAGLFRTPISGGVQSATSAHGLPRPALAVRNLMEQVRACCCS